MIVGLEKIHETVVQVEQLQTSLAHKRKELNDKNEEANLKLKQMIHDQQEAEKKRIGSQELQIVLAVSAMRGRPRMNTFACHISPRINK